MGLFKQLLSPDFMPHGYCYLWDARMVWLHVISDGLIALSHYCIQVVLIYFIRKNRDHLLQPDFLDVWDRSGRVEQPLSKGSLA